MTDKVVSINGRTTIDETNGVQVHAEFVEMVERFLAKVKAGEVASMYMTGFTEEGGHYQIIWYGPDNAWETLGIMAAMQHHLMTAANPSET